MIWPKEIVTTVGTAYPSGAPVFTPGVNGFASTCSLVLCVCFVLIVVCPFSLGHCVLSVLLLFTDSYYLFGIFKLR
jgi:hypothetical protein